MNIKILKKTENKLLLNITHASFELVNSIRRSCINDVPTLAIEDVSFFSNNSALYDEVLAHRLGLIPLVTDLKSYNKKSECKCKGVGCARCTVELSVEAKGPRTVYTKDLKSTDKKIKPVFDEMPIIKLFEGQEVKFIAKAELGTSKEHAKFSPCFAYYKYFPIIKINNSKSSRKAGEIVASCPRHILKKNGSKVEVDKNKILDCNLCLACQDSFPEIVSVESKEDNILFYIESWGQHSAKDIFNIAIENLSNNLKEFGKKLK